MTRTGDTLPATMQSTVDAALRRHVGLAVGAVAGGLTLVHTAGVADERGGAIAADTLFQIGSVTKLFTALALAEAVARSELTLDTPLASFLPEAPTSRSGAPITLGQLATHTSRAHLEPESTALPAALRLVQEPRVTVNRWVQIGLGWHLSPMRGTEHTALWHNGGTGGFASYIALLPEARTGVVVLTNTARPVDRLGLRLLREIARSKCRATPVRRRVGRTTAR